MIGNVIKFELQYRLKRPATWLYFGILFLMACLALSWDNLTVGGGTGQVKENAPVALATISLILSVLPGFFLMSGLMGVPIVRDREHKTESMLFTTILTKGQYLFGRYIGSLLITLLVFSGILFGLITGSLIKTGHEDFLAFNLWHHLSPFLVFVLPNVLIGSALFFMGGALSRNLLFVFMQGILLLMVYLLADGLLGEDLENRNIVALMDPFGLNTSNVVSQYWTIAQKNTQVYAMEGLVLFNRLIWLAVGTFALAVTYFGYKMEVVNTRRKGKKAKAKSTAEKLSPNFAIHKISPTLTDGFRIRLQQVWGLARLYFAEIFKSVPFIAIAGAGMVIMGVNAVFFNSLYGTPVYASTGLVLELIGGFNLFFIIIIVFYTGELLWRERDVRFQQIFDATPTPNWVTLSAKFLGFSMIHVVMILLLIVAGILIQVFKGFPEIELGLYFRYMFSETFFFLILFTALGFFVHTLVNQKFVGHAVMILFFIVNAFVLSEIGLEHKMFNYASGGLGSYSDMNQYGHYVNPFNWFQLYWFGMAAILMVVTLLFSQRGTDMLMKTRLKLARYRYTRPAIIGSAVALMLFVGSGCFVYYNTNVLNEYRTSDQTKELQANYEKELSQFAEIAQPKIVETNLKVDIYPEQRDFEAEGYYYLKNLSDQSISDIHIQLANQGGLALDYLRFDREAAISKAYDDFDYFIYSFAERLAPGDSVKMDFKLLYDSKGFVEGSPNDEIAFNGTFFNSRYFPSLGYNDGFELGNDDDRKEYDLPVKEPQLPRDDPRGLSQNLFGDDADYIRFEIEVSTSQDQIAIAPGYLQKKWEEDGRRYYHYKMDQPMVNFYSILSARYEKIEEVWDSINLEIYYHKGHEYNLDRMMKGMKRSLAYYSENFSPYQYQQMRIMEFPRYSSFAQSFANTVPFSEGIGFTQEIEEDAIDMPFYVTAHEMAHQWWGHQVPEAGVRGNAMISESMSQYSALMVMKQEYSEEMIQKFLAYELDRYLSGRASETKKERPLIEVQGQNYIHYRKGAIVMYSLQDYIGEDSVNAALKRFNQDWAYKRQGRYPNTEDLLKYFRAVTPDSMQYLIKDMFETITLFENRTKEASITESSDGQYTVHLSAEAIKYRADSLGNETEIPLTDWIDVGVFGETEAGKDTLLYLQKHPIRQKEIELDIVVPIKPTKAGIDPINKLIDRNPDDNVKAIIES